VSKETNGGYDNKTYHADGTRRHNFDRGASQFPEQTDISGFSLTIRSQYLEETKNSFSEPKE
jgi:hypothetical protein